MSIRKRLIDAFKQNWLPGLALQSFALALVIGYYQLPAVGEACARIGELKVKYGYLFSALSTSLFGGLIPFLILWGTGQVKQGRALSVGVFYILFWFWKGAEIDLLYRIQVILFGEGTGAPTIIRKVLVDQFGYNLFYAVLCIAIFNLWKENNFSLGASRTALNRPFFTEVVPSMLFSTWLIWLPTTAIVYSMPTPLQIPLFCIVLCFYVLLITIIGTKGKRILENET